jgi:hypothetical protein
MSHISTINMLIEPYKILPPSLKESISRVVLNQSFQTLTEFIGKSIKIYDIKLVSLDISYNIFS